jgi:excisionase family DNA binding protein
VVKGYLTTSEAAERLGVSAARVRRMILDGVISGAEKVGRDNLIPEREIARLESIDRPAGRPKSSKS